MTDTSAAAFVELVCGRRGHFHLESGHHGGLWLDLDALFAEPRRLSPYVDALARAVRAHGVTIVCGPLLGGAFLAQSVAHALDVEFCFTERVLPREDRGLYRARYVLPPAFRTRVRGQRVAMVDDVMSAGSALRGTYSELRSHGADPVVAGALLVMGALGESYFRDQGIPVEAVARQEFDLWLPEACPLCASGMPLEDGAADQRNIPPVSSPESL